jgi:tetratricopeptide (TPR) repeat protein
VANVPLRKILGLNQQTYQRLYLSLNLNLRRQIFIAVCDDLVLRDRLATQLQHELNQATASAHTNSLSSMMGRLPTAVQTYPRLVSVQLSLDEPNPLLQVVQWLNQSPPPIVGQYQPDLPAFQILGIEHLTRQAPAVQRLFLTHLQTIERHLPLLDFSLLFWTTQPWFYTLSQSAPEFWRCRTGVFEFIGDPTPLTVTVPERFGVQSSRFEAIGSTLTPDSTRFTDEVSAAAADRPSDVEPPDARSRIVDQPLLDEADESPPEDTELAENPWLLLLHQQGLDEAALNPSSTDALTLDDPASNPWLQDEVIRQDDSRFDRAAAPDEVVAELPDNPLLAWVEETETVASAHLPPDNPSDAPPQETGDNPWLPLGEELVQLYELLEEPGATNGAQPHAEPIDQLIDESIDESIGDLSLTPPPAAELNGAAAQEVPPPAADQAPPPPLGQKPVVPPIQLPPGLADADRIQLILQHITDLHQQNAAPAVLADAYRSVGNLFRDRVEQGEVSPQNLSVAIQFYEQALQWLSDESHLWVDILNDLGNLYWMTSRILSTSSEALVYLQQSIQAYQLATSKIDPQTKAQTYPMVQNNLGAAYADLARHDNPVNNLELSVQAYREALHYRTPDTDPLRYASTQNNLGTTYWNLAQYKEQPTNLKLAITSYSEALRYYNPAQEPLNYAMIQNNLGTAYWNLSQHEPDRDWLSLAVTAYRRALIYRTLEVNPAAHAATQNNLGTAYWHLADQGDQPQVRQQHLQQAIAAYEASLRAADYLQTQPNTVPLNFDLFATHNNLGLAHYQLATDPLHELDAAAQTRHLQAAIHHHVSALQGWSQQPNLRQTAFNCIVQTIRAAYNQQGLPGQNAMMAKVPGELLPEILPKL